jgi:hypothetical protein
MQKFVFCAFSNKNRLAGSCGFKIKHITIMGLMAIIGFESGG